MAISNAQRQAEFRQWHLKCPATAWAARINVLVSKPAKAALMRLAQHNKATQGETIQRLILEADSALNKG